jgi:hypothetical protein
MCNYNINGGNKAMIKSVNKVHKDYNVCKSLKDGENSQYYVPYKPAEIIDKKWEKWNMPDEISYKGFNGNNYLIMDDNLLPDICSYLRSKNTHGTLPYLHIEGKDYMECYENPANKQILAYLNDNLRFYDIYTPEGEIVMKGMGNINNEIQQFYNIPGSDMKNIELELDSEQNIQIKGRKIILNIEHFPIRLKTEDIDGKKIKRVINVRDKNGSVKVMIN